jgi:hypothetical protein
MPSCALCGVETLLFVQSIPICVDCDRNSEKDFSPHHIEGHCRARTPMPAGLHSLASMTFDYINDIRSAIPALVDKSAAGTEIRTELLVQIAASVLPLDGADGPDRLEDSLDAVLRGLSAQELTVLIAYWTGRARDRRMLLSQIAVGNHSTKLSS